MCSSLPYNLELFLLLCVAKFHKMEESPFRVEHARQNEESLYNLEKYWNESEKILFIKELRNWSANTGNIGQGISKISIADTRAPSWMRDAESDSNRQCFPSMTLLEAKVIQEVVWKHTNKS